MDNYNHIKELFPKYLNNSLSREEYERLLQYFEKAEDNAELHQLVLDAMSDIDNAEYDSIRLGRAVDSVAFQLREKLQPTKTVRLKKYISYAAAIFLFGTAITAYYTFKTTQVDEVEIQLTANDVKPGHRAATLTLANGKKILLNDMSSGKIASEAGIDVSKNNDGSLVYKGSKSNGISRNNLNTLSTANGETYELQLSDGTKVWLNAGTTLQYSVNLDEPGRRTVKLVAGEAYFEVTKNKRRPFVVETSEQTVEVLGTHFNINSYANEGRTVTTLAEGSVKVAALRNDVGSPKILKPGQQAINLEGKINVIKADLQTALAWKDGYFRFNGENIESILLRVARWYDIELVFTDGIPEGSYFGKVSRSKNISQVLKALESTKLVHFKIEGRKVYVRK